MAGRQLIVMMPESESSTGKLGFPASAAIGTVCTSFLLTIVTVELAPETSHEFLRVCQEVKLTPWVAEEGTPVLGNILAQTG